MQTNLSQPQANPGQLVVVAPCLSCGNPAGIIDKPTGKPYRARGLCQRCYRRERKCKKAGIPSLLDDELFGRRNTKVETPRQLVTDVPARAAQVLAERLESIEREKAAKIKPKKPKRLIERLKQALLGAERRIGVQWGNCRGANKKAGYGKRRVRAA